MATTSSIHDLKTLILSYHPVVTIETMEEDRARSLVRAAAKSLDLGFFEWSITRGLVMAPNPRAINATNDPFKLLRHIEGLTVEAVFLLKDLSVHLGEPAIARQFRELSQRFTRTRSTLILTGESVTLAPALENGAVRYHLALPGREELRATMEAVLHSLREGGRIKMALGPEEIERLLDAMRGMTINQARQAVAHAALENGALDPRDIARMLEMKARAISEGGLLEYYPPGDNDSALGGFERLKEWLERAQLGFSKEAQDLNLSPPKGILLVGVQGCGKSLASKAIARAWELPLLRLDAGGLYDKFIGETEKRFRKAIELAESMAPVVLWIDEIEKGMTPPSGQAADGGVSQRLFGAFLTWLQEKKEKVFVVATANDVFSLPPELLRKGRFDEIFFVDLPEAEERRTIFEIHLALRKQDAARFDLPALVSASEGFSGAEIEQAVIAGLYRALHDKRPLTTEHLLQEIKETLPLSITRREDIDRLRPRKIRGSDPDPSTHDCA
ncbi:MAG: AAA family ATPase [Myxococcota bacterium]